MFTYLLHSLSERLVLAVTYSGVKRILAYPRLAPGLVVSMPVQTQILHASVLSLLLPGRPKFRLVLPVNYQ